MLLLRKLAAPRSKALLRLPLVAERGRPRCSTGDAERVGVAVLAEPDCFQMMISHGPLLVPDELILRQSARGTDLRLFSGWAKAASLTRGGQSWCKLGNDA